MKRLRVDIVLAAQFCRAYVGSDWFQYNLDLLLWCEFALYHDICPPMLYLMYMDAGVLLLEGSTNRITMLEHDFIHHTPHKHF